MRSMLLMVTPILATIVACISTGASSDGVTSGASSGSAVGGSSNASNVSASVNAASSASSSSGAPGPCGTFTLSVDQARPMTLTSNCEAFPWDHTVPEAVGWYTNLIGLDDTLSLIVNACVDYARPAYGMVLEVPDAVMAPATYSSGVGATLYLGDGGSWGNQTNEDPSAFVTVTTSDATSLTGTFDAIVSDATGTQHTILGSFNVCHGPDELQ